MSRFVMMVRSHAVDPERQEEYDYWYENVHIPEVLTLPEFVSAQRFCQASHVSGEPTHQFMTQYEIEAETSEAALNALLTAAQSGQFNMLPWLDTSTMVTVIYQSMTRVVTQ